MYKILIGGSITWYSICVYLKYQFGEINQLIEFSLRTKNTKSLLNAILRYKSIEQTVNELNKMYKIMLFMVYLFSAPGIDMSIYIFQRKDTSDIMKLISISVGTVGFTLIFAVSYLCAQVLKTAHKSRPLLYSFIIENKLSVNQKMKIQNFLERLSSHEVVFYCLDFFPMNNRRFFQFIMEVFMKYFLLIKLL